MAKSSYTHAQAARMRTQAQSLVGAGHDSPVDVARHMLAMQGQDFNAVQWALGVRSPGSTRADVYAAFDRGELVRSWPMRGTIHVVPAEDLGWMLDLVLGSGRSVAGLEKRWELLGIDEAWLEQVRSIITARLEGGGRLTRSEFGQTLEDAGIELGGSRLYHSIWYLAQTRSIVWGPMRGAEQELVLTDEWIPTRRMLEGDEALGEFARRYVHARGPVTIKDFAWWTGLRMADARRGFATAADDILAVDVDGTEMFMTHAAHDTLDPDDAATKTSVLALLGFDETVLGYQTRDAQLPRTHAQKIVPGNNGMFKATIHAGGQVVGTWSRHRRTNDILVTAEPFTKLGAAQAKRFDTAVKAYGAFLETTALVKS